MRLEKLKRSIRSKYNYDNDDDNFIINSKDGYSIWKREISLQKNYYPQSIGQE